MKSSLTATECRLIDDLVRNAFRDLHDEYEYLTQECRDLNAMFRSGASPAAIRRFMAEQDVARVARDRRHDACMRSGFSASAVGHSASLNVTSLTSCERTDRVLATATDHSDADEVPYGLTTNSSIQTPVTDTAAPPPNQASPLQIEQNLLDRQAPSGLVAPAECNSKTDVDKDHDVSTAVHDTRVTTFAHVSNGLRLDNGSSPNHGTFTTTAASPPILGSTNNRAGPGTAIDDASCLDATLDARENEDKALKREIDPVSSPVVAQSAALSSAIAYRSVDSTDTRAQQLTMTDLAPQAARSVKLSTGADDFYSDNTGPLAADHLSIHEPFTSMCVAVNSMMSVEDNPDAPETLFSGWIDSSFDTIETAALDVAEANISQNELDSHDETANNVAKKTWKLDNQQHVPVRGTLLPVKNSISDAAIDSSLHPVDVAAVDGAAVEDLRNDLASHDPDNPTALSAQPRIEDDMSLFFRFFLPAVALLAVSVNVYDESTSKAIVPFGHFVLSFGVAVLPATFLVLLRLLTVHTLLYLEVSVDVFAVGLGNDAIGRPLLVLAVALELIATVFLVKPAWTSAKLADRKHRHFGLLSFSEAHDVLGVRCSRRHNVLSDSAAATAGKRIVSDLAPCRVSKPREPAWHAPWTPGRHMPSADANQCCTWMFFHHMVLVRVVNAAIVLMFGATWDHTVDGHLPGADCHAPDAADRSTANGFLASSGDSMVTELVNAANHAILDPYDNRPIYRSDATRPVYQVALKIDNGRVKAMSDEPSVFRSDISHAKPQPGDQDDFIIIGSPGANLGMLSAVTANQRDAVVRHAHLSLLPDILARCSSVCATIPVRTG